MMMAAGNHVEARVRVRPARSSSSAHSGHHRSCHLGRSCATLGNLSSCVTIRRVHATGNHKTRSSSASRAAFALPSAAPGGAASPQEIAMLAEGLEAPVQVLYLGALLTFLGGAAFFVVRQVLERRELEISAYELGEKARANVATPQELYELGSILARKKVYSLAVKHLEDALAAMPADDPDGAAVHNALGYAYSKMDMFDLAKEQYEQATDMQPGYVLAWNNLGDVCEKSRDLERAAEAYTETLKFAPENEIAKERLEFVRRRISTYGPRGPAPAAEDPGW